MARDQYDEYGNLDYSQPQDDFPDQAYLQQPPGSNPNIGVGMDTSNQQQSSSADHLPGLPGVPNLQPGQSQISSWAGYSPQGVEDMWGQFLTNSGYGQAGQTDQYGFGGWGNAAAGTDLNKLVSDFNARTGLQARAVGNDKIDFGAQGGGVRDVIRNVDPSGAGQWWISQGGGAGGGAPAPSGAGGGGVSGPGINLGGLTTGGNTGSASPFGTSIRDQILKLIGQGAVSENDPDVRPAIDAYRNASQRALAQERNAIAERANAQGMVNTGAFDNATQAAMENAGTQQAQFAGNLVAQAALARRNQIAQLLQVGAGVMSADDQRALQLQLAQIDAGLRQQSITNQNSQFYDQLGANVGMFNAQQNRNSILDLLRG